MCQTLCSKWHGKKYLQLTHKKGEQMKGVGHISEGESAKDEKPTKVFIVIHTTRVNHHTKKGIMSMLIIFYRIN